MDKVESKKVGADEVLKKQRESASKESEKTVTGENPKGSTDADPVLAGLETEKNLALIEAWEENEKAKVENKAHKNMSAIGSWENKKKASLEAKIKVYEEKLVMKKAEFGEKMKNKAAGVHKSVDDKKARIEAKRGEEVHKVQESADSFRKTGVLPRKFFSCFSY